VQLGGGLYLYLSPSLRNTIRLAQDEEDEEDVESKTICDESMPCVGGVHLPASEGTVYTEGCWAAETFLGNMTGPAAPWHVVGMAGVVMDTSEALATPHCARK
jgi:hypothetical protein